MTVNRDHSKRIARMRMSLEGLSVGDAFGERFFLHPNVVESLIEDRAMPHSPWPCTDDTVMALSIVDVLEEHGEIHQDQLATYFASRYSADPARGYGRTAHHILRNIAAGEDWRDVAPAAFSDGMGSKGNGSAMRSAPLCAYFENDAAPRRNRPPYRPKSHMLTSKAVLERWQSLLRPRPSRHYCPARSCSQ